VVLTLIILNLPSQTTARLKLGIGSIFLPMFGLASSAQQAAVKAGDALATRGQLLRENEQLRRENQQIRLQLVQAGEAARENERLRQLFGWQRQQPRKYKLANVVLREPANWWRAVQIDLGSRDGVRENLPVLTPEGLVGRTAAVSLTRSQVVLLGDPNCKVAARVINDSRDTGVISASGVLDTGLVVLGYLPRQATVKPGQTVVTSGLGELFPKDIPIGTIVDSQAVEFGLYTTARVKLAANLGALEQVWVLMEP
jgi:rod shape-determining protein MreC